LAGGGFRLASIHGVDNVKVIQNVVETAIIWQPIKNFADCLFGLQRDPPICGTWRHYTARIDPLHLILD
jgi:hypothetical protein